MIGLLTVQTDDDFSIKYKGELYSSYEFTIRITDIKELDKMIICGPYGSPRSDNTKCWEFESGIQRIKENPNEEFDTTGGNRGVHWIFISE
jgi:hypothetical protein